MKLVFTALAALILFSCNKSNDDSGGNNNQTTVPYLKFKGNGTLYEFYERDELKISRSQLFSSDNVYKSTFYLSANKAGQNIGLDLRILSKTSTNLETTTYNMTASTKVGNGTYSSGELILGSNQYWDKAGDYTEIKITKLQNGNADGTFTASITKSTSTEKFLISEGEFKNIKVIQ